MVRIQDSIQRGHAEGLVADEIAFKLKAGLITLRKKELVS